MHCNALGTFLNEIINLVQEIFKENHKCTVYDTTKNCLQMISQGQMVRLIDLVVSGCVLEPDMEHC